MKIYGSGRLIMLLALAVLVLAACQPPALPEGGAAVSTPTSAPTKVVIMETSIATSIATPTAEVSTPPSAPPPAPSPAATQVPEGWQVLDNAGQGYSLIYPHVWEIGSVTKYSRVFHEIPIDPGGVGPSLRLYVSVFPRESTNPDWEVYNFIPGEKIQEYLALPIGESLLKVPAGSPAPDYFTYTRLPDRMVAGKSAAVIENSKVWEAPTGTKDRIALMVTENTMVILGMYYQTPEQLAMFERVLDSFQLASWQF